MIRFSPSNVYAIFYITLKYPITNHKKAEFRHFWNKKDLGQNWCLNFVRRWKICFKTSSIDTFIKPLNLNKLTLNFLWNYVGRKIWKNETWIQLVTLLPVTFSITCIGQWSLHKQVPRQHKQHVCMIFLQSGQRQMFCGYLYFSV